jgi:hypothetical protein
MEKYKGEHKQRKANANKEHKKNEDLKHIIQLSIILILFYNCHLGTYENTN